MVQYLILEMKETLTHTHFFLGPGKIFYEGR